MSPGFFLTSTIASRLFQRGLLDQPILDQQIEAAAVRFLGPLRLLRGFLCGECLLRLEQCGVGVDHSRRRQFPFQDFAPIDWGIHEPGDLERRAATVVPFACTSDCGAR
jgi:hypothetical protein